MRTSILFATVSPCALRGTCPPHPNAAVRCEPFRFVQGLRPLRRKAAIPGMRRGPDVSRIWETSEHRRYNGFAPRQARKTGTAVQRSENEDIHGGHKPANRKENTTIPKVTTEHITTAEEQLAQERHRLQRMENRQKYLDDKTRKQRAHRLITRGAAVESVFPDVKDLSEPEFYELVEQASEIPAVVSLVMDAADKHNQAATKKEVS